MTYVRTQLADHVSDTSCLHPHRGKLELGSLPGTVGQMRRQSQALLGCHLVRHHHGRQVPHPFPRSLLVDHHPLGSGIRKLVLGLTGKPRSYHPGPPVAGNLGPFLVLLAKDADRHRLSDGLLRPRRRHCPSSPFPSRHTVPEYKLRLYLYVFPTQILSTRF